MNIKYKMKIKIATFFFLAILLFSAGQGVVFAEDDSKVGSACTNLQGNPGIWQDYNGSVICVANDTVNTVGTPCTNNLGEKGTWKVVNNLMICARDADDSTIGRPCKTTSGEDGIWTNDRNLVICVKVAKSEAGNVTNIVFDETAGGTTDVQNRESVVNPVTRGASGLIPCGGKGQPKCTLCYLIVGFNGVIDKILKLSFFIGLAVLAFAAVLYIVSAGDSNMTGWAKSAIKNSIIGIVVMFSAWLMVNYTMHLLGTKPNLGIVNVGSWSNFQCAGQIAGTGGAGMPSSNELKSVPGKKCGNKDLGVCLANKQPDAKDPAWDMNYVWLGGGTNCPIRYWCAAEKGIEGSYCGGKPRTAGSSPAGLCTKNTCPNEKTIDVKMNFIAGLLGNDQSDYPICASGFTCCQAEGGGATIINEPTFQSQMTP